MSITVTGLVLIPLGIFAFLARPKWLYVLTIFFAPFSATSLINNGSGDTGSGLQPATLLGGLLLLRVALAAVFRMKISVPQAIRKPLLLVLLFVVVCGISLIMPFVINGKILVMSRGSFDSPIEPLYFKSSNISYLIATLFGVCLAGYVARQNLDAEEFLKTLRVYLASGVFISLWGVMQAILGVLHLPYPAAVFNNSASPFALESDKMLESVAFPRVYSVALEPSILSIYLVGMAPILIAAVMGRRRIFGKYRDWFSLGLLLVTLALTASSTGYVSLGVVVVVMAWTLYKFGRMTMLWAMGILVMIGLGIAAAVVVPPVRSLVQEVLLNKADSASALERGMVALSDAQYFQQYPVLGLGWGSAPAHDLILGILANTGVLGLSSFALFVGYLLRKLGKDAARGYGSRQPFCSSYVMFLALLATCCAYLLSGLPSGPTFWLLIGMGIAACGQITDTASERRKSHGLRWFFRQALRPSAQVRLPLEG